MSNLDMNIILAEILPRLPIKFIIRSKCVSKSFQTAISSRNFARLYLRYHSLSSNTNDLLVLPGNGRIICYDLDSNPHSPALATFVWDDGGSAFVVGSTNGLLCISTQSGARHFSLLNPSTRIYKHFYIPYHQARVFNLGFAYDHANFDYKIVAVCDHNDVYATKSRVTMVYSLNINSWKIMEREFPTDSMEKRHGGVLIHDSLLHWTFWSPSLRKRRIGCFDVCKTKWTDDVLLPHYYYDPDHKNCLLDFGVVDNNLFSSFENRVEYCFDVWVMKEYGVQDSWVKLFSIPVSNDLRGGVVPLACRRGSSHVLIRQRHSSRIFWYSKRNGETTEAKFPGAPDFSNLQAYMSSRSLVDLPGGKLFVDA